MTFRILTLDGGGYRGRLAALMLIQLQQAIDVVCDKRKIPRKSIKDCFDLIAGTSTGSLIASALTVGKSAQEVFNIFANDGRSLFPPQNPLLLLLKASLGPIYDGKALMKTLNTYLGDRRMSDLDKALLITVYDSWNNRPLNICSYDPGCEGIRLVDACRGSSAYPAAFPSHCLTANAETKSFFDELINDRSYFSYDLSCVGGSGIPLVDGGIAANNPAAVALAESKGSQKLKDWFSQKPPVDAHTGNGNDGDTLMVSIGTGQIPPDINYQSGRSYSVRNWTKAFGNPLLEMVYVGLSRANDELCRAILGADNHYRFQPVVLSETVKNPVISRNSVVLVTEEEKTAFGNAVFSATDEVDRVLDKVCYDYFNKNDVSADPSNPLLRLNSLAERLV